MLLETLYTMIWPCKGLFCLLIKWCIKRKTRNPCNLYLTVSLIVRYLFFTTRPLFIAVESRYVYLKLYYCKQCLQFLCNKNSFKNKHYSECFSDKRHNQSHSPPSFSLGRTVFEVNELIGSIEDLQQEQGWPTHRQGKPVTIPTPPSQGWTSALVHLWKISI